MLAELRAAVPFDAFAWLLTDPVTCVGSSPVAEVPVIVRPATRDPRQVPLDGQPVDEPGAGRRRHARRLDRRPIGPVSDPWCSMLSAYGIGDVASVVLRDAAGCWGFIDLWRRSGPFDADETHLLGALNGLVIPALRRAQLRTFEMAVDPRRRRSGRAPARRRPGGRRPHRAQRALPAGAVAGRRRDGRRSPPPRSTSPLNCSPSRRASTTGRRRRESTSPGAHG